MAETVGGCQPSPALVKAALQLQMSGYAIIENVISQAESERYVDRCWSWLESLGTGRLPLLRRKNHGVMSAAALAFARKRDEHICGCRHSTQ